MKTSLLVAILCVSASLPCQADPRDFIEQQKQVLRELDTYNVFPQKVLNDMAGVKIVVSEFFIKDKNATRKSAFADFKNKRIILNRNADFSGDLTVLAIHESLSAAGWLDVNYENSVLGSILLRDKKQPFLKSLIRESYKNQINAIARGSSENYVINDGKLIDLSNSSLDAKEESGVVLVGGGGDAKTAQIKEKILELFNEKLAFNPEYQKRNYRSIVFGLKIETVNDRIFQKKVRVKTTFNSKRNYYERIFYVPTIVDQKQAIRDIWYIVNFLGTRGSPNFVMHYYIPRNDWEKKQFREHPEEFTVDKRR